jgi:hypothetical protein
MAGNTYNLSAELSWEETDKETYEQAWESDQGHVLYVEDTVAGEQATFDDFSGSRYQVNLRTPRLHGNARDRHPPDDITIDTFDDLDTAVERAEDLYNYE